MSAVPSATTTSTTTPLGIRSRDMGSIVTPERARTVEPLGSESISGDLSVDALH